MRDWKKSASAESVHAMWHDPSTYDHLTMGPPYLPGQSVPSAQADEEGIHLIAKKASSIIMRDGAELGGILTTLRALAFIHQTAHWQTRGPSFYADHTLFERLYNDTLPLIDAVAERCVGSGGLSLVNPTLQASGVALTVERLAGPITDSVQSADDLVMLSLRAVEAFLVAFKFAYEQMEARGALTGGTDNLLQGVADKHEEFAYLLKQRIDGVRAASYRR